MSLFTKLTAFFRRGQLEREMSEEMRAHLEMQTDAYVARGMSPVEARLAAVALFACYVPARRVTKVDPWSR